MFRKTLFALVLTASGLVHAQIPISGLPNATTPLGATDKIIVNQPVSGTVYSTRQAPLSALAPFFPPITSHYVLQAADPLLPQSRTLAGTANQVILTDGGALGNLTLSLPQSICITCGPTFSSLTLTGLLNGFSGVFSSTLQSAGYTGTTGVFSSTLQAASLSLTTPLQATQGGTGFAAYAVGDLLAASTTTALSKLSDVAAGSYLRSGGVNTLPLWSTLTLPNAATTGDILFGSGTNAVGNLADVSVGSYLRSGGVTTAPLYSTVKIPNTDALGDLWIGSSTNNMTALAGNITTTKQFLTQTGTGTVSASPAWGTIAAADLPGSFSGFANPSGLIGLAVVNGAATTATRSDATHALDQSISPTWTGTHTFTSGKISAGVGSTATTSLIQPVAQQVLYSLLGPPTTGNFGPGIQVRWDGSTGNRFIDIGQYDNTNVFTSTLRVANGAVSGLGPTAAAQVDMTPDTGTFTLTYTGMTAGVTCTATWTRIGKLATLSLCAATGTSNTTTLTATGLPAAIQPATLTQDFFVAGLADNGALLILGNNAASGRVTAASGTLSFFKSGSSFTAAGTKGMLNASVVSYLLN